MKNIPNIITSLNLAAGFIAIICAAGGNLVSASWFILIAMILDFLDGFAARLLKAYSALGKELDSLSDMVSFGIAPSLIMYMMLSGLEPVIFPGLSAYRDALVTIIIFIPVLMSVCAAFRLAKFNLDPSQATSFSGLPTPASALAVISIVIAGHYSGSSLIGSFVSSPLALGIYTIIISLLMVSKIPMLSLKIKGLALKGNEGRYMLAGLVLLSFIIFGISAAPLIIPLYIVASFLSRLF
ncbi:MAG: CDP-diacylglycerol--serine O-phosphatidyltransferase [Bacteroidales bacterium]|nr:CDP-diacylglycerol--serine O-phosphatidyltransferase [Bacteroidales bacterium]